MDDEKKFAILIDGDNISAKYIAAILNEMTSYGVATYKRIYGDWTSPNAAKWREELLGNSITPIQQFSNVSGKNATDSALIIDAMDILYIGNVDGFCIVSSDSDFTRLASRIRESGLDVIGMGEEKTPSAFRNACTKFISLENILESDEQDLGTGMHDSGKSRKPTVSRREVENTVADIITENENRGRVTFLGEVGSRLNNKYPDFDVRNYGYSLLSKFLEESPRFVVRNVNNGGSVSLRDSDETVYKVKEFIIARVKRAGKGGAELSPLRQDIHNVYPDFSFKDKGYSKFSKFVQSIPGIRVESRSSGESWAVLERS